LKLLQTKRKETMQPEDLDKLFKERLGNANPMPPADLWNKLQDRLEEEHPVKEEKSSLAMWVKSYAIAATTVVALSAGVIFYNLQQEVKAPSDTLSKEQKTAVTNETTENANSERLAANNVAVAGKQDIAIQTPVLLDSETGTNVSLKEKVAASPSNQNKEKQILQRGSSIAKNTKITTGSDSKDNDLNKAIIAPVQEIKPESPASLAASSSNLNATPVEIIIKRTVPTQAIEPADADEDLSEFEKKRSLAKNIFKQVKNLSNGEHVDLSELGINANRIALETKIGNQKISKVIHL
jgi:negative regulator of sigma E activity